MTRDLRVLSFALLAWGIGEAFFIYTQTLYLASLGADPVAIGGILAIASLVMTLSHIPAGLLADRIGSKPIILVNWVFSLAAAGLMYLAQSLSVFTIGIVLYNLTGFVLSPLSVHITAARGNWTSARALTTVFAMFNIGGFIGSTLGWLMGEALTLRGGYGAALIAFAISTLSVFLISDQTIEHRELAGDVAALTGRKELIRFFGLAALILFGAFLSWPLTANYLQEIRGVSTDTIRLFGAFNSLGMATLSLWMGRLESRKGIQTGQVLIGVSTALLWLGRNGLVFGAGYFLEGSFRAMRSLLASRVENLVSPRNRGLAFGILETLSGLTLTITPIAAGILYDSSPASPYPVSLGIILLTILLAHHWMDAHLQEPTLARSEP